MGIVFKPKTNRAIVIGGSISGLLSARILSDYFELVTIIETNAISRKPEKRIGVPQSSQPHILFARGYQIILELFPKIELEAYEMGALPIDWCKEFHLFHRGWNATQENHSGIASFTCSRVLLEFLIRERVLKIPNVSIIDQSKVTELIVNETKDRVAGAKIYSKQKKTCQEIQADLVVESCGRKSKLPSWLKDCGLQSPPETIVDPLLGYATRRYKDPLNNEEKNWKVMLISQSPPNNNRLGYLSKIENEEWIATVGGYGADYPLNTEDSFLEFANSLPSDRFSKSIRSAEPLTPVIVYRATSNRLRHYESIFMPDGLISIGDSVCALCPIYGQGISVSALSVIVLQDWLKNFYLKGKRNSSNIFQRKLMKSNLPHWNLAIGQDAKFKTTKGRESISENWVSKSIDKYANAILERAQIDSRINYIFIKVTQLITTPISFFHPYVLLSVVFRKKIKSILVNKEK